MDCPHYEQLSYAGDTRLQLLCRLALCPGDTALMQHTLLHFWDSTFTNPARWTSSSAPSRGNQLIPPFSIWWVLMISDYVRHTGDTEFVRPMLPAARAILEHWFDDLDPGTGLVRSPDGWNFTDWCFREGAGYAGMPLGGRPGEVSSVLNLTVLHGLEGIEELELQAGEDLLEKGFTTTPENFGTTRSDAHAWSAHPILMALEKAGRATGLA